MEWFVKSIACHCEERSDEAIPCLLQRPRDCRAHRLLAIRSQ